jgi:hypothetical protein
MNTCSALSFFDLYNCYNAKNLLTILPITSKDSLLLFFFSFFFFCIFKQPSDSKELNVEFALEDLETIKVIGKGSGGVVQLVRHKWVGKLFALKVSSSKYNCFLLSCAFTLF